MKKCEFYKTMSGGYNKPPKFEKTTGYYEILTDPAGNEITICFEKTPRGRWNATEKTSGLLIYSSAPTRAAALEIIREQYMDIIAAKLKTCRYVAMLADFLTMEAAQ